MSNSTKRVGRMDFILRTLLVTAMAFALEFLGDDFLHLTLLPDSFYVLQRVTVFGVVGLLLLAVIDGRLADACLPHWCRYPVISAWYLATSIPAIWPSERPIGIVLFILLLTVGGSFPAKPFAADLALAGTNAEFAEKAASPIKKYEAQLLVGPVGFLRGLLTIACVWVPLIRLEETSAQGAGVWIARFGYFLLSSLCFLRVLGRLEDAGRLPRARYGLLFIGIVLLIRMLGRFGRSGNLTEWQALLLSDAAFISSKLHPWLMHINGYEILVSFLLIQVPLALLPSKLGHGPENNFTQKSSEKAVPIVKTNDLSLAGPFEYLRIILVMACMAIPLIYMDSASRGGVGSWIARSGYLVLIFFWFSFANGRLEDAGWAHSWYPPQYALVVFVASVMPIAFHWVNGYEALAIFVIIQLPTLFLKTKPRTERPEQENVDSETTGQPRPPFASIQ